VLVSEKHAAQKKTFSHPPWLGEKKACACRAHQLLRARTATALRFQVDAGVIALTVDGPGSVVGRADPPAACAGRRPGTLLPDSGPPSRAPATGRNILGLEPPQPGDEALGSAVPAAELRHHVFRSFATHAARSLRSRTPHHLTRFARLGPRLSAWRQQQPCERRSGEWARRHAQAALAETRGIAKSEWLDRAAHRRSAPSPPPAIDAHRGSRRRRSSMTICARMSAAHRSARRAGAPDPPFRGNA
jgi:hypothetical protein